jgi:hypothetical protein
MNLHVVLHSFTFSIKKHRGAALIVLPMYGNRYWWPPPAFLYPSPFERKSETERSGNRFRTKCAEAKHYSTCRSGDYFAGGPVRAERAVGLVSGGRSGREDMWWAHLSGRKGSFPSSGGGNELRPENPDSESGSAVCLGRGGPAIIIAGASRCGAGLRRAASVNSMRMRKFHRDLGAVWF